MGLNASDSTDPGLMKSLTGGTRQHFVDVGIQQYTCRVQDLLYRVSVYGRGFPFANINIVLDVTMTLDDSSQCDEGGGF